MAAPLQGDDPSVEDVLLMHDAHVPADGKKAEVIEGLLVLSPSPSGGHGFIQGELLAQLIRLSPERFTVTNTVTLEMAATGERYVPDILVIDKRVVKGRREWRFPADCAELVVEIVSPHNARIDRVVKVRGYAACGVPLYLLVDPLEQRVTLFSEPAGESYQRVVPVRFGGHVTLPEPFDGKIDTITFD